MIILFAQKIKKIIKINSNPVYCPKNNQTIMIMTFDWIVYFYKYLVSRDNLGN